VAPALDFTDRGGFDEDRFAEAMGIELALVQGIRVVPVGRVRSALLSGGHHRVESPSHAVEVAEKVGADAVLVFSISVYDPFDPPKIVISAELYKGPGHDRRKGVDTPADAASDQALSDKGDDADSPLAQTQRIFDTTDVTVLADVKEFAKSRSVPGSALGWRRFLVNQQDFIKYCCNATVRSLVGQY
jgi:hypothetical protein